MWEMHQNWKKLAVSPSLWTFHVSIKTYFLAYAERIIYWEFFYWTFQVGELQEALNTMSVEEFKGKYGFYPSGEENKPIVFHCKMGGRAQNAANAVFAKCPTNCDNIKYVFKKF